jgi:hypothetical protein
MRFMMLMIPRVYQGVEGKNTGSGFTPRAEAVKKMMKYNEELAKAGVLVSLEGLHPPATGARVTFSGGKAVVTDGPFVEAKELLGGYWMIDARSKEVAVEWAKRCPAEEGDTIEVRKVFESSDFPPDVRKAAENPAVEAQLEKKRRASAAASNATTRSGAVTRRR